MGDTVRPDRASGIGPQTWNPAGARLWNPAIWNPAGARLRCPTSESIAEPVPRCESRESPALGTATGSGLPAARGALARSGVLGNHTRLVLHRVCIEP